MASRILKITATVILIIMPYSTVLSFFSPYETPYSFQNFIMASLVFTLVGLLLIWAIVGKNPFRRDGFPFFLLGMLVAPPLMLGIPETGPKLLDRITEEHFRYGLLLLATLVFSIGFILLLKKQWKNISFNAKLIVIPFAFGVALMFWDNYSSYHFSTELKDWIATGHKAEDFFPGHDFQEFYRTLGRTLIYVLIPWLSLILWTKKLIKKWQAILLTVFCLAGILFFFLFNFVSFQFYFPFMIPAIALAPSYWLGIALLSGKNT